MSGLLFGLALGLGMGMDEGSPSRVCEVVHDPSGDVYELCLEISEYREPPAPKPPAKSCQVRTMWGECLGTKSEFNAQRHGGHQ